MSPSRMALYGSPVRRSPSRLTSLLSPTRPSPAQRLMSALSMRAPTRYQAFDQGKKELDWEAARMEEEAFGEIGNDNIDDEDEETLRLKLEAIEARLKLKRLMNTKKAKGNGNSNTQAVKLGAALQDAPNITRSVTTRKSQKMQQEKGEVQVSASPSRARRQDNINGYGYMGMSARGLSPSRAPNLVVSNLNKERIDSNASDVIGTAQQTKYLERKNDCEVPLVQSMFASAPSLSFAERLLAARQNEDKRQEKAERVKASRTSAFSIGKQEMEELKSNAVIIQQEKAPMMEDNIPSFSRADILGTSSGAKMKPTVRNESKLKDDAAGTLEPYSGLHLSRRIIPHQTLTRTLSGKKILLLKDLLRDVKAPDFELPDVESDIVVMAAIASKSDPKKHKNSVAEDSKQNPKATNPSSDTKKGKFMVMTLVDLTYEVDLFLFNSGFLRFWKLSTGTLVAILNPSIMPPPPGKLETGRFSLVINSDADTILEVGTARDLGYCEAKKKDGNLCSQWVNRRRTHFCEWHVGEAVGKKRVTRMEVNSMDTFSGRRGGGAKGGWGKDGWDLGNVNAREKYKPGYENQRSGSSGRDYWTGPKDYDRETHTRYFINKNFSTSSLLDRSEGQQFADRKEREEFLKKKLIREEKERSVARQLARADGERPGGEYMAIAADRGGAGSPSIAATPTLGAGARQQQVPSLPPVRTAQSLGLLPTPKELKRKRSTVTTSAIATADATFASRNINDSIPSSNIVSSTSVPLGWGTSLKTKLSRMREGETLINEKAQLGNGSGTLASPARKKTRFLTERGIKEAGRESLGTVTVEVASCSPFATTASAPPALDAKTKATTLRKKTSFGWNKGRTPTREVGGVFLDDSDDDELVIV